MAGLSRKDRELIEEAKRIMAKPSALGLVDTGDVGSALITSKGNVFRGVNLGFYCGIASCAEYQAIGTMISSGEKAIRTIVAVSFSGRTRKYEVIPPCGKCREMIWQTAKENQNAEVIISESRKVKLRELLPHPWDGSIEK